MSKMITISDESLRRIIRETLEEFFDPDYAMEIKEEFEELLKKSLKEQERGETFSIEHIKDELGFE